MSNTTNQGEKPLTKQLKLKLKSVCGCGEGFTKIERTVPIDSPLKKWDMVEKTDPSDKIL